MDICLYAFVSINKNISISWLNRNLLCKFAIGLPVVGNTRTNVITKTQYYEQGKGEAF